MKRRVIQSLSVMLVSLATGSACGQTTSAEQPTLSDSEIRLLFVRVSTAAYDGECPCPETISSRGTKCGGNSAYLRGGGNRPLCNTEDVTEAMIRRYREALAKQ